MHIPKDRVHRNACFREWRSAVRYDVDLRDLRSRAARELTRTKDEHAAPLCAQREVFGEEMMRMRARVLRSDTEVAARDARMRLAATKWHFAVWAVQADPGLKAPPGFKV